MFQVNSTRKLNNNQIPFHMKKFLTLIPAAAIAFTVASCNKDEVSANDVISVSSVYKCVVWEYSATWCNPCGTSGYPAMHDIMSQYDHNMKKAVGIFMHPNDAIVRNEPAGQEAITDFFQMSGTPSAGANLVEGYPTYLEPKVRQAIADHPTAKAGVGMAYTIEGNTINVTTKTVFFDDLSGSYALGVYVTEDKIMNEQSGQTGVVEHNDILRSIAGGKSFGTVIAVNPSKGAKVDGSYTISLPTETRNKDNCHVVCVIYKVDPATGNPTDVINANKY